MAASTAAIFSSTSQPLFSVRSVSSCGAGPSFSNTNASNFMGAPLRLYLPNQKVVKITRQVRAAAVATPAVEEIKEYSLSTWAEFDLGIVPVFWKTMNGLPPMSGEKLSLFYNPAANKVTPNKEFGIAFNGGFNQPIMCGGEPRMMLRKIRGKADPPIYSIKICVPKHAVNMIFSFTNGTEWDGPYKLQFQIPKAWRNKQLDFFNEVLTTLLPELGVFVVDTFAGFLLNAWGSSTAEKNLEGLAKEMSKDGACDMAIFPDSNIVVDRCAMIGNLTLEGGDRCQLDLVPGCIDPSSPFYDPLANVDDGSCPIESDTEA